MQKHSLPFSWHPENVNVSLSLPLDLPLRVLKRVTVWHHLKEKVGGAFLESRWWTRCSMTVCGQLYNGQQQRGWERPCQFFQESYNVTCRWWKWEQITPEREQFGKHCHSSRREEVLWNRGLRHWARHQRWAAVVSRTTNSLLRITAVIPATAHLSLISFPCIHVVRITACVSRHVNAPLRWSDFALMLLGADASTVKSPV